MFEAQASIGSSDNRDMTNEIQAARKGLGSRILASDQSKEAGFAQGFNLKISRHFENADSTDKSHWKQESSC